MSNKKYTREELISICEDAVVHHSNWQDRDSYLSQLSVQAIYKGLTAGIDFTIGDSTTYKSIWITFTRPINMEKLETGKYLEISSREEYFEECDPERETEMFDSYTNGIDWNGSYTTSYLPTRKRLEERGLGEDWT
jgi:hypothetical protein